MPQEPASEQPVPRHWLQRLLTVFFDLLYQPFAWTYDLVSWIVSWGQWQDWIRVPLPYLGEGPILELGSGPGHLMEEISRLEKPITGLDLSPQMLRIARKRLTKHRVSPRLVRGVGQGLPFTSETFQQAVATFPAEYIFTAETLKEIYRVLQPGGEFLCVPMAWINESGLIHRFLAWLFRFTGQSRELDPLLIDRFTQAFSNAGLTADWQIISLKRSRVLLIRARKETAKP